MPPHFKIYKSYARKVHLFETKGAWQQNCKNLHWSAWCFGWHFKIVMAYLVFLVITFLGLLALFHYGLLSVLVIVFLYRDGLQGYLASFGILYLQHEAFAILDDVVALLTNMSCGECDCVWHCMALRGTVKHCVAKHCVWQMLQRLFQNTCCCTHWFHTIAFW